MRVRTTVSGKGAVIEDRVYPEVCDKKGAADLAVKIKDFWSRRPGGDKVHVRIEAAAQMPGSSNYIYGVRSNLLNALPRR